MTELFQLLIGLLAVLRCLVIDLPQRVLSWTALLVLMLVLFLHRRRLAKSGMTGAEAARRILEAHRLKTRVLPVPGMLVDCYLPRMDTIALSERTFHGRSIGAVAVAAHEAGHAIQRRRWFLPWCARQLLVAPASLGLMLCFWVWLTGMAMEDQRVLATGAALLGLYVLFLAVGLVCEADASRRGMRELISHGLLETSEARIARRILRWAFVTYFAAFVGSTFALGLFLSCLDWTPLLDRLAPVMERIETVIPQI